METSSEARRWALSAVAALVVAAVLVAGWWLSQDRSSGTGAVAAGSGTGGGTGGGVTGDPGSVDGGAAGPRTGVREDPAGTGQPAAGRDPVLARGAVRVDSYVLRGQRLLLNYTTGVPECYGEVAVADVAQRHDAVTVTLRSVPPENPAEVCIDLAVTGTVAVELAEPLGRRWVLDGGFEPAAVVRQVSHPHAAPPAERG